MTKKKIKSRILITIIIFSIIGIFLSSMLTLAKYNDKIAILCGEDTDNNCNVVQNSEFSNLLVFEDENNNKTGSIPISLAGLVYYLMVLTISIILLNKEKKNKENKLELYYNLLFILAFIGLGFSVVFTIIQAFIIKAYCTYCLISAFNTLVIFGFAGYLYLKK